EGRRVNHLDDGGEDLVVVFDFTRSAGGEEDEHRPQAFAAVAADVAQDIGDVWVPACEFAGVDFFDVAEFVADHRLHTGEQIACPGTPSHIFPHDENSTVVIELDR